MGAAHISNSLPKIPRVELTAVADSDPARLQRYSEVAQFTDPVEMIQSGKVNAVLIATPHYAHTTIGVHALEAGLHVLVEKPISVHKADCEKLIAAHRGQVFAAMFNQRTDGVYKALRSLVQSGELGSIKRATWHITNWFRTETYYRSGGWRATWAGEGGGVLLNQAPHNLDLFQWIVGMPKRVHAFCGFGRWHDIEVEDDVTAYLEFENGATGTFVTSTGEFPGTNRLEISGDRGRLVMENGKITFERTESPVGEFCRNSTEAFASIPTWQCEVPAAKSGNQHTEIIRNFVGAILDGEELIAPATEGIHSVELANAMILSSLTSRTVELPMDSREYEAQLSKLVANSRQKSNVLETGPLDLSDTFGKA
jgi:predicted dehydrogenase